MQNWISVMADVSEGSVLDDLLEGEAVFRQVDEDVYSLLPPDAKGAPYDTRAAAYDRIVGSALYNRLLWGVAVDRYHRFVQKALASDDGPFLDAGCGSAVFTAEAYKDADRPLLLVDRSRGMLDAARRRLAETADGELPDHVTLLQGDVDTLPLRPRCIETILSMGMLHLFEDVTGHVARLLERLAPGGTLFATSLVAERVVGRQYLRLLHSAGEVAAPRSFDELREKLSAGLDAEVDATRTGSMAFLTVRPT
jgi:SAM-dependent methyltransferase